MSSEIVATGVGVVTPIGIGNDNFWESLMAGRSGVVTRPNFEDSNWPARIFAPVQDFVGKDFVKPRKSIKVMCMPIQHGFAAAQMALADANLDKESLDPDRVGIVFGTETFFADPLEVADVFRKCTIDKEYQHERWGEFAMREIQPLWMLKYLPNMVASHISIGLDARGPSNSICQAEASSILALIEGANLIQRGVADVVICGGTGSRLSLSAMLYRGFHNLSTDVTKPEKASRPFDRDRSGLVVGEGAGAIVLESRSHAEKRGAQPLAKVRGWGRSYADVTRNSLSEHLADNFELALNHSGCRPDEIGHYHAHATGEVQGDREEAVAVQRILGDTPVFAPKANFGHLGPGGSAVELCAAFLAKKYKCLPPNANLENLDPNCPVNAKPTSVQLDSTIGLKSTRSFTGQIASIVFE